MQHTFKSTHLRKRPGSSTLTVAGPPPVLVFPRLAISVGAQRPVIPYQTYMTPIIQEKGISLKTNFLNIKSVCKSRKQKEQQHTSAYS